MACRLLSERSLVFFKVCLVFVCFWVYIWFRFLSESIFHTIIRSFFLYFLLSFFSLYTTFFHLLVFRIKNYMGLDFHKRIMKAFGMLIFFAVFWHQVVRIQTLKRICYARFVAEFKMYPRSWVLGPTYPIYRIKGLI